MCQACHALKQLQPTAELKNKFHDASHSTIIIINNIMKTKQIAQITLWAAALKNMTLVCCLKQLDSDRCPQFVLYTIILIFVLDR